MSAQSKHMRANKWTLGLAILLPLQMTLAAKPVELLYLSPDSVNVLDLLPDPPGPNSYEQQCEAEQDQHIHETRTKEQKEEAKEASKFDVFYFSGAIGPWFTAANCPKTAKLFEAVAEDGKYFEHVGKAHWNRPRPAVAQKKEKDSSSYPSGHATRSMAMAQVLEAIFPDRRTQIEARARQIGWDRVILGDHFPSDIYAGRVLGKAIGRALLANSEFQADLAAVKQEIDQARQRFAH
ncbi:MAG TPA: phosphatase PAP2 family protein [Tepidisphaeraceae bacterium]|nr:phosphatase PAP2 family protein [Tepidisphaeraceae bacterium]